MSSLGSPNPLLIGGAKDYEIERSLRFNKDDSAYFNRTPASDGSLTTWTWSGWLKKGQLRNSYNSHQTIFRACPQDGKLTAIYWRKGDNATSSDADCLSFAYYAGSGATDFHVTTYAQYRDIAGWYHVVAIWNTTTATANDRMQLWINGSRITVPELQWNVQPTQNLASYVNDASYVHTIGKSGSPHADDFLDGYLSEVHFVDGQVLDASNFGETNEDTGQWVPKKYAGSYGTNGFYLNFSDNSGTTATTLGKDSAGSNNWTPNNFSVAAGDGNDSVIDTPTNNYCVLNPLSQYDISAGASTYTNGNLDCVLATQSGSKGKTASTFEISSGKWYWECKYVARSAASGNHLGVGLANADSPIPMKEGKAWYYYGNTQRQYYNDAGSVTEDTTMGVAVEPGDMFSVALDLDNGKWYVGKNNTWINSGNPVSGSGSVWDNVTGTVIPTFSNTTGGGTQTISVNFGQKGFAYTPPTGFKALCTANLSEATIKKGSDYFNTVLYTGTGSSRTVPVGFAPNFTWIKKRNSAENHEVQDTVRGATKRLASNTADQESTVAGSISAFTSDGFTVVDAGTTNENTHTYAAWNWKGAGSNQTLTAGDNDTVVNANPTAGFSIVTWTGTGSTPASMAHGLGVAPELILIKTRSNGTNWVVYNKPSGISKYMHLPETNAAASSTNYFADGSGNGPSSTVFWGRNDGNTSGQTMVAYCFASVEGYSKVGSYTGNGSADGTFIYTGFKPAFVLSKSSSHAEAWNIFDNVRDPDNKVHHLLVPNTNTEENNSTAARELDFLSNGFKMRGTNDTINGSGKTYIYLAIAERPFRYANAR